MKKKIIAIGFLISFAVYGAASRTVDVDILKSSDHTKTWTPPAATDTLVGRASTDTLTNKSMSGGSNTFTNIPNSATTATDANTPSAIVARDGSGNFSAGTITGNLTGSASNNVLKAGDTMTGYLTLNGAPTASLHAATKAYVDGAGGGYYQGGQNLITNNSWENDSSNWTASGGTYQRETGAANIVPPGVGSASWDPAADTNTLSANTITITANDGLSGRNGVFSCSVKTAATDLKMQVYDGTNVISPNATTDVVPSSSAGFVRYSVNFIFPSSGTVTPRFYAQSNSAIAYIDQCFFGLADGYNLSQVSQATLYGYGKWATAASCQWTTTSASFANFGADTDCNNPTVSGYAAAAGTKIPALVFSSLPPGEYEVEVQGFMGAASASDECAFQISDGTNSDGIMLTGATATRFNTLIGRFSYTTAQSSLTFQIQAKRHSGSTSTCFVEASSGATTPLLMIVKRFPTSSEIAVRSDTGPSMTNATTYTLVPDGTTTDPTVASNACKNEARWWRNGDHMEIEYNYYHDGGCNTGPATGSGQYIFPIPSGYTIDSSKAYIFTDPSAGGILGKCSTYNNTGTLGGRGQGFAYAYDSTHFGVTAGGQGTAIVTTLNSSDFPWGNGTIVVNCKLSVPITGWTAPSVVMPIMVGGVSSNSSGMERVERLTFGGASAGTACTGSPCTINRQSGSWVSSVTRGSAGVYTVNFAAGMFSSAPTCSATGDVVGANPGVVNAWNYSTSSINVDCYNPSASHAFTDCSINLTCQGPR